MLLPRAASQPQPAPRGQPAPAEAPRRQQPPQTQRPADPARCPPGPGLGLPGTQPGVSAAPAPAGHGASPLRPPCSCGVFCFLENRASRCIFRSCSCGLLPCQPQPLPLPLPLPLSLCLSLCLSLRLCLSPLCVCLSVSLSLSSLSLSMSVCLSVSLLSPVSVSLSLFLSLCLSVSLLSYRAVRGNDGEEPAWGRAVRLRTSRPC